MKRLLFLPGLAAVLLAPEPGLAQSAASPYRTRFAVDGPATLGLVGVNTAGLLLIRAKTGVDPEDFRRLSSHLEKIEEDLSDSRAERVHRKSAIYGEEDEAE